MSILETPRILFRGQIAWDPVTTNNYTGYYDEDAAETVFQATTDRVEAFRKSAIEDVVNGSWNPDGTYRSSFFDTGVSGVDLGAGATIDDPFYQSAASFTGMLVDLEPYGSSSSQIFFDTMQFGIDGGYRILLPRRSKFVARCINFSRNSHNRMIAGVASVVWQTSFHKDDGIRIDAFDSPALQALGTAMQDGDVQGLTVRFNAYRTVYYGDPTLQNGSADAVAAAQSLTDKLNQGGWQPNPARSLVVGVVGLWRDGEPMQQPGDRKLIPVTGGIGVAFARVDGATNTLQIDLENSIPETDAELTKANLGTIEVVASDPLAPATLTIGTIPYELYDRDAYDRTSGIVTLPLRDGLATQLASMTLSLRADAGGLLAEQDIRTIPAVPSQYVDEGGVAPIVFQLYRMGVPLHQRMPLTIYRLDPTTGEVTHAADVESRADGVFATALGGAQGGVYGYVVRPRGEPAPVPVNGMVNTQSYDYMYARVLPADADVAGLPPTWENVYTRVLSDWNAMAPCMDNWLDLADPDQIKRFGPMIRRLTDPTRTEDYRYMPVTRDLSRGKRTLLYRFLDDDIAWTETAASKAAPPTPSLLGAATPTPNFSRKVPD